MDLVVKHIRAFVVRKFKFTIERKLKLCYDYIIRLPSYILREGE